MKLKPFECVCHGSPGWPLHRVKPESFFSSPTLSTPELTVFARVDLVTVVSSLSRDGIGVPLGSHPPRLLVAFLLLK